MMNNPFSLISVECCGEKLMARPIDWDGSPHDDDGVQITTIELSCPKCGNLIQVREDSKMCAHCQSEVKILDGLWNTIHYIEDSEDDGDLDDYIDESIEDILDKYDSIVNDDIVNELDTYLIEDKELESMNEHIDSINDDVVESVQDSIELEDFSIKMNK